MNENSDKHVVNVHARARKERREVIKFPQRALGAIVDQFLWNTCVVSYCVK